MGTAPVEGAALTWIGEEVDAEGVISGIKGMHESICSKETEVAETGKTIRRLADEIGKARFFYDGGSCDC